MNAKSANIHLIVIHGTIFMYTAVILRRNFISADIQIFRCKFNLKYVVFYH